MKSRQRYEARARVAKALAHPSRLMTLDLLAKTEMSVTEITKAVGADQSTVSKHLAVLKEAGLIDTRKEGTTSFHRVTCACLDGFFSCLEAMVVSDIQRRQASGGRSRR
jgi:ArsR family transcriptional regulator, arsenate/arsenite/antimonite-responsive transcriptional repressor